MSGTPRLNQYQKGKTNPDFTEARDSEWQWCQLGHMQVCTSLQTDNHASTQPLSFFTGRMPFLPPKQQRQSTEGTKCDAKLFIFLCFHFSFYHVLILLPLMQFLSLLLFSPFPPLDSIGAMMLVWSARVEVIGAASCCVVYDSCVP